MMSARCLYLFKVSMIPFLCLLIFGLSCTSDDEKDKLPASLPFEIKRPDIGEPLSAEEITSFTRKITGFWEKTDYFRWVLRHSHGVDASFSEEMPDYKLWWQDTKAIKKGDVVTFSHHGGADNLMLRTSKVLSQAISGYLMSGDETMGRLVEQYSKGLVALFLGMVWGGEDPPVETIMARAIFTRNHSYITDDGRKVTVDYDPVKKKKYDWNAHTIRNPDNPYWGDIWVRTMRSKDDVPHMFRTTPLLLRVAEDGKDENVRQSARKAYEYIVGFARDIVDSGYYIRTKDGEGTPYIPREEKNPDVVKDLASFVNFEPLDPHAECNAKLATALIARGEPLANDCGDGNMGELYEEAATIRHYFNYAIVRYFHMAAIVNALTIGQNEVARELLEGLIVRAENAMADEKEREEHREWDSDLASFLLAAAASGMPLTSKEARHIQKWYSMAADHYRDWEYWDLWDPSVPDGEYDYKPSRNGSHAKHVRPEELTFLIEYCYSPWRNKGGISVADCDIVGNHERWGK